MFVEGMRLCELRSPEHMTDFPFTLDFLVRDYECDLQGVVNHAVYLHYLEHTRHEFLKTRGIDFAALAAQGIHLVVVRVEIDYKAPLRSGDAFRVGVRIERVSKVRVACQQAIERRDTGERIVRATILTTALNARRRPFFPPELEAALA